MTKSLLLLAVIGSVLVYYGYCAVAKQMEVSCPSGTNQVNAWYWDGQKCESCNQNCYCDATSRCTKCLSNKYARVYDGSKYYCVECPGKKEYQDKGKKTYGTNYDLYLKDYWDYGTDVFQENNFQLIQKCYNQAEYLQISLNTEEDIVMSLQAQQCSSKVTLTSGEVIQVLSQSPSGSICWFLRGCKSYTDKITTRLQGESLYGSCKECFPGYYLDEYNKCTACEVGCATCLGPYHCETCKDGYWKADGKVADLTYLKKQTDTTLYQKIVDNNGYCLTCGDIYTPCEYSIKENKLVNIARCTNSQYFFNTDSKKCEKCGRNCECKYNAANSDRQECQVSDITKTYKCFEGYVENTKTGVCDECPKNCLKCTNDKQCETGYCKNGYFKNSAGGCDECKDASRCKPNDQFEQIGTQCYTKYTGSDKDTKYVINVDNPSNPSYQKINSFDPEKSDYYLFNGKCVQNQYLCRKMMDGTGKCETCYEDTYYKTIDNTCEKKIAYCTKITTHSKCEQCAEGYYLSTDNSTCKVCKEGCVACTDDKTCSTSACKPVFYYDTIDKFCRKCTVANCKNCDDNSKEEISYPTCKECVDGYRLWLNDKQKMYYCEKCEENCKNCEVDRKQCTQCKDGYYTLFGACVPRKRNCVKMVKQGSSWICRLCAFGYRIVDGRCMPCYSPTQGLIHCPYVKKPSNYFFTNINVDKTDKENYNYV